VVKARTVAGPFAFQGNQIDVGTTRAAPV